MREILDGTDLEQLDEAFADVFYGLRQDGVLKRFVFDQGHYLLATVGTMILVPSGFSITGGMT